MADHRIPAVAAAIALAELDPRRSSYKTAPELWGELNDGARAEYRRMAVAALAEADRFAAPAVTGAPPAR